MSSTIEDFVCLCCTDYALSPIFQCTNSHIICDKCKSKLKNCPMCRVKYGAAIRNYKLEEAARKLKFPCSNKYYGCEEMLGPLEKQNHEQSCGFMEFRCPLYHDTLDQCCCISKMDAIADHLFQRHLVHAFPTNELEFHLSNLLSQGKYASPFLMECYGGQFVVFFEPLLSTHGDVRFFRLAKMIGFQAEAEKYELTIKIKNGYTIEDSKMNFESITNSEVPENSFTHFDSGELDISQPFSFYFLVTKK